MTGIATLFGYGALLLAAWRMLRHEGTRSATRTRAAGPERSLSED